MDRITRDLRFGLRQLRLNPTFTAVAVLSLALGIGANTAIFQLIDAIRLRSLPVQKPQELAYVDLARGSWRSGWSSTRSARLTFALWESIRNRQQAFSGMAAWSASRFNLAQAGRVRYAEGLFVNGDFFQVLGIPAEIGRTFTLQDDRQGCGNPGAIISHSFWQSEFAGDPAITSRNVRLDGKLFPILGVTSPGFFGLEIGQRFDIAVPLCADPMFYETGRNRIPNRTAWWLSAMGRLKPGWTIERAHAQLQFASPGILQEALPPVYRPEYAKKFLANKLSVTTGAAGVSRLRQQSENPLWILFATTALVLLIACANLANLLLARASVREREIAVRQAVGASRWTLILQLLSESSLLALFGALLGALLAGVLSRALIALLSTKGNHVYLALGIDWRVLGFTTGTALATCLLFGLAPAFRATQVAPASVMRSAGRGLTAGRERFSLRRILVVAQVAMSLVLLAGALLFVRSLQKLLSIDPGFRPEGIVAMSVDLRAGHYPKERILDVQQQLLARLRERTRAVSAAQVFLTPVSGAGWDGMVWADGTADPHQLTLFNGIGPDYFRTIGTSFVAGRDLNDHDTLKSARWQLSTRSLRRSSFTDRIP
jgi:predicted permease